VRKSKKQLEVFWGAEEVTLAWQRKSNLYNLNSMCTVPLAVGSSPLPFFAICWKFLICKSEVKRNVLRKHTRRNDSASISSLYQVYNKRKIRDKSGRVISLVRCIAPQTLGSCPRCRKERYGHLLQNCLWTRNIKDMDSPAVQVGSTLLMGHVTFGSSTCCFGKFSIHSPISSP
jgi:hypothetical protein